MKGLLLNCHPPNTSFPIQWKNDDGLKILGITFFTDLLHTANFNWREIIDTFDQHIEMSKARKLSYRGKVLNINTLGLANFWYLASIYTFPPYLTKRVDKIIFNYLWDDKKYQPIQKILNINKCNLVFLNILPIIR